MPVGLECRSSRFPVRSYVVLNAAAVAAAAAIAVVTADTDTPAACSAYVIDIFCL